MAINQPRNWLIAYDIANPRRLNRIRRQIIKDALPVQYSLYLYHGSQKETQKLLDELSTLMDTQEDDLRAYPIPSRVEIDLIGQHGMPSNLILVDQNLGKLIEILKHNTLSPEKKPLIE